jgi:DHA2 family multidrug resistance protein
MLLAMANFMAVLDVSIANVSVPNIAGGLAASTSEGTWVITSYAVAEAIIVPLTGWLASRFGTVRVLVLAMAGFGACSALCALATSFGFLVASRILQGVAGGPLMPLSQALLLQIFPKERQPVGIALWSMTSILAPVMGPIVGGALCEHVGWPSIFWINVPIALICVPLLWRTIRQYETPAQRTSVDGVGLGLLIIWVGALQLMLDLGKDRDWFASTLIVNLTIIAAVGFVAFLIWELTDDNPIVKLRILSQRGFSTSLVALALAMGAYFASIVLTPLWLQTDMGYTAQWAGYAMTGSSVSSLCASILVGRLLTRIDPRWLSMAALLYLGLISFVRAESTSQMSFGQVLLQTSFMGFGMSFFLIPLATAGFANVDSKDLAGATGLFSFVRSVSSSFGVSIVNTAWENGSARFHVELAGVLNDATGTISALTQSGLSSSQALSVLNQIVDGESTMLSTNHVFMVCAVAFLATACTIWLLPLPKSVNRRRAH